MLRDRAADRAVVEDDVTFGPERLEAFRCGPLAFAADRPAPDVLRQDVEPFDRDEHAEERDGDAGEAPARWRGDHDGDPGHDDQHAVSEDRAAGCLDCGVLAIAPASELAVHESARLVQPAGRRVRHRRRAVDRAA